MYGASHHTVLRGDRLLALLLLLLGVLLTLRLVRGLQLRQRLLDRLCDRVARLHVRHLVSGVVQRAFHNKDVFIANGVRFTS
ncbi:hypothetical protein CFBP6773_00508 [Xanthomonas arboricola pv. fragariae]|nr:hypothetical protein CFBP6773_00508 [Xanthomonas arboricola pv. fragariae]